ncbi:MAG: DUF5997 family protein [Arthrobacter sp.]|uniref:DUF5997 family protein n=1 Tax=Arthrobacter TaxID=1663 RepID=UPI00264D3CF6|nr:DUF5997 family protein [Micrococcaceae bacterium]MDN5812206.1 DUF5997 family protein [Micrococcaceae bacterium]MDN5824239.1 DUF5997 family protein [Micrococcaceae bacterium]MDN5879626.1 DUF5997 family protein [Micrococcaceae bacterium]MDN5885711.1 DUF5997 family protein [Micrococcaceae bacterium]
MTQKSSQSMKPATAAKKLGVYLPATPAEFQDGPLTRDALDDMMNEPPEWLVELRRTGPHPRPVIARKLNVSISGLARGGIDEALTTAQIDELLADRPEWLQAERTNMAEVRAEEARIKEADARKAAARETPGS